MSDPKHKPSYILYLFVLSWFVPFCYMMDARAKPHDATSATPPRITIQADTADLDRKTGINVYRGNVVIKRAQATLTGDLGYTYLDKQQQLEKAQLQGRKRLVHYKETSTTQPEIHAWARQVEYFPKTQQIILIGEARIDYGADRLAADKIIYTIDKHQIYAASLYKIKPAVFLFHHNLKEKRS